MSHAADTERLIVFAGAGLSMLPPTGLPSWREANGIVIDALCEESAELLGAKRAERARRILLERHAAQRLPPEYQAEILADVLGSRYFHVLRHLDGQRPNAAHLALAELARAGHVEAILTTNFDRLLEVAFELVDAPCQVLCSPEQFADPVPEPGDDRCTILKLHGTVADPDTLIDTLAQRKRGLPASLLARVRALLHAGPWVFLGYSGLDLEAEPGYLGLAAGAQSAVGLRWLVRPGTQPRPGVERLVQLYRESGEEHGQERAELVVADLADWLLEFADRVDPALRARVDEQLARVPPQPADPLAELKAGAAEWAATISPLACAIALTRLVAASAEPQLAIELWRTLLAATSDSAARDPAHDPAPVVIGTARLPAVAVAEHALGCALAEVGQHEQAVQHLSDALARLESAGGPAALASLGEVLDRARRNLGKSCAALGEVERARELFERALAGARSRDDGDQTATLLNDLAEHEIALERLAAAETLAAEALAFAQRSGSETSRIQALNNLGIVAQRRGDFARALELYRECEQVCTRLGADGNAAVARGNQADTLILLDRDSEAEELHLAALTELTRLERHAARAESLQSLGALAERRADSAQAEQRYREAHELLGQLGDPLGQAQAGFKLAQLQAKLGRFDLALEFDQQVIAGLAGRRSSLAGQALAHAGLCLIKLGRLDEAREIYGRCHALAVELESAFLTATALHNLGTLDLLQQNNDDAVRQLAQAVELWQRTGHAQPCAMAQLAIAAARLDQTLAALSTTAHTSNDPAQQRSAAQRMTALYPPLIDTYRELGAVELAAHCAHSAGSTHGFLEQPEPAIECYSQAARAYRELALDARRDDCITRIESLLGGCVRQALDSGQPDSAAQALRDFAQLALDLGLERAHAVSLYNLASLLSHFPTRSDEARQLAQTVSEAYAADTQLGRAARELIARLAAESSD